MLWNIYFFSKMYIGKSKTCQLVILQWILLFLKHAEEISVGIQMTLLTFWKCFLALIFFFAYSNYHQRFKGGEIWVTQCKAWRIRKIVSWRFREKKTRISQFLHWSFLHDVGKVEQKYILFSLIFVKKKITDMMYKFMKNVHKSTFLSNLSV